jgi:hypothetical protein
MAIQGLYSACMNLLALVIHRADVPTKDDLVLSKVRPAFMSNRTSQSRKRRRGALGEG